MSRAVAKYYLVENTIETEVFPINASELSVQYARKEELIFDLFKELNGEVKFDKTAFVQIYAADDTTLFQLVVRVFTDDYTADFCRSKFYKTECSWDLDRAVVSCSFTYNDAFAQIVDNWDVEHNILSISPIVAAWGVTYTDMEFIVSELGTPESDSQFELLATMAYPIIGGTAYVNVYARQVLTIEPNSGLGWQYFEGVWARNWSLAYPSLDTKYQNTIGDFFTLPAPPDEVNNWEKVAEWMAPGIIPTLTYMWIKSKDMYPLGYVNAYNNGRDLKDVLQYLVTATGSTLSVKSNFFWNDLDYQGNAYPDYNYVVSEVLGVDTANKLNNLSLHQITDIKNPRASNPATIARASFKKILADLNVLFDDLRIFIEGSNLRIEHAAWFIFNEGIDLTALLQPNGRSYIEKKNSYSYDEADFSRYLKTQFAASIESAHKGVPVEQVGNVKSDRTNTRSTELIVTDFLGIQGNADDFPDEMLVLLQRDDSSDPAVESEENKLSRDTYQNAHLSIPNLQYYYHRNNKPVDELIINNASVDVASRSRNKKQTELNIPYPFDFESLELQKTEMGWGEVDSAEFNLKTGFFQLNLLQE